MGIKKLEQFIFEDENQKKKIVRFHNKINQILKTPFTFTLKISK